MKLINDNRAEVEHACLQYKVRELYAFGSVVTSDFQPGSDIDFIVSILSSDPLEYAENYFELKFELEKIFKRKIDLIEQKAIRKKMFEKLIDQKKRLVYARGN